MTDWIRVTPSKPCPICEKPDWCTVDADGSAACCMRVESGKSLDNDGWLHRLVEPRDRKQPRTKKAGKKKVVPPPPAPVKGKAKQHIDFPAIAERYRATVVSGELQKLAHDLGVTVESLNRLSIGWDGEAWTFPMVNAASGIVGIRRRLPSGRKLSFKGGKDGVFAPADLADDGLLLVCEGPSDTAAMLDLGFDAIGRPSCSGGAQIIQEIAADRDVVIVADADAPGQSGAARLAAKLAESCAMVRVITPPGESKDARAWKRAGATREDVEALADAAEVVKPEARSGSPVLVRMADVEPEQVQWLWRGRIAIGKLTILSGNPGVAKSFLSLDIAARVSSGTPWPDALSAPNPVGGVVLLSAEDDVGDTVRPRLDAAGADSSRIVALQAVRHRDEAGKMAEDLFSIVEDLSALEEAIRAVGTCRLVIVDPVSAFMGGTDSHRNTDVRAALAPLSMLAAKHKVAVLAISHLRKSEGAAIYRTMGSLAYTAAARAVWLIAIDQADPDRRLFLNIKNNLSAMTTGLAYRLRTDKPGNTAHIAWEPGEVTTTADEALALPGKAAGDDDAVGEAVDWLSGALEDGPMGAREAKAAALGDGITSRTLDRAKKDLGVVCERKGFGKKGQWTWRLPKDRQPPNSDSWRSLDRSPETPFCENVGALCEEPKERQPTEDANRISKPCAKERQPLLVGSDEAEGSTCSGDLPPELRPYARPEDEGSLGYREHLARNRRTAAAKDSV